MIQDTISGEGGLETEGVQDIKDDRINKAAQEKQADTDVPLQASSQGTEMCIRDRDNIMNQEIVGMPVIGINQDAQTMEPKVVPTVITLPQTGELAAQLMDELSDAMDRIEELEAALKNAGFAIDWGADVVVPTVAPTDVPVEGEEMCIRDRHKSE